MKPRREVARVAAVPLGPSPLSQTVAISGPSTRVHSSLLHWNPRSSCRVQLADFGKRLCPLSVLGVGLAVVSWGLGAREAGRLGQPGAAGAGALRVLRKAGLALCR